MIRKISQIDADQDSTRATRDAHQSIADNYQRKTTPRFDRLASPGNKWHRGVNLSAYGKDLLLPRPVGDI